MTTFAVSLLCLAVFAPPDAPPEETAGQKRLRAGVIARQEEWVKAVETMLANIKAAKVVPLTKGKARSAPSSDYSDYIAPTSKHKTETTKVYTKLLATEKKKLEDLKAGGKIEWSSLGDGEMRFGQTGLVGTVFVENVIDKNRAVVAIGTKQGKSVLATFPTSGFVAGSRVELDGVWQITGTSNGSIFEITRADR